MLERIKTLIIKELNPEFIILFGSYAKGIERADSDLDLAYYADKALPAYEKFLLAQKLADSLGIEVDLVDIRQVNTVFAAQIFFTGKVIFCNDESLYIKERMKALSMYAHLNEERAEIFQRIEERGSIYEK